METDLQYFHDELFPRTGRVGLESQLNYLALRTTSIRLSTYLSPTTIIADENSEIEHLFPDLTTNTAELATKKKEISPSMRKEMLDIIFK